MDQIRRDAFTTEEGIVKAVPYFIPKTDKHREILSSLKKAIGDKKCLEVSSFSEEELGRKLSAFNIPYRNNCLECVFQAAKIFEKGGPYKEWLTMSPRDVKKDPKKKESGKVIGYEFEGELWATEPKTAFYDYIYIDAVRNLLTEADLEKVLEYQYFTDIALDPEVSTNCQARSMALIQLMLKKYGRILDFTNKEEFIVFHKQNVLI